MNEWNEWTEMKWNENENENEWMNEWNEWINEWMNEWTNEWLNEWMTELTNERMNDWMNDWMNEWMKWMNWNEMKWKASRGLSRVSHQRLASLTGNSCKICRVLRFRKWWNAVAAKQAYLVRISVREAPTFSQHQMGSAWVITQKAPGVEECWGYC